VGTHESKKIRGTCFGEKTPSDPLGDEQLITTKSLHIPAATMKHNKGGHFKTVSQPNQEFC